MHILIINGANLNLTGKRENCIYGETSFEVFLEELKERYAAVAIEYYQSNIEGELVDKIQAANEGYDGIILNAGGYTHTSVVIADAVRAVSVPVVEVHISNVLAREEYRHKSLIAPAACGCIFGFGLEGYRLAVESFRNRLS